jgi:hypothetical protein
VQNSGLLLSLTWLRFRNVRQGRNGERVGYLDADGGLVVLVGGEDLRLFGGHSAVPVDNLGHHTSGRLNAHRQSTHIHQHNCVGLHNHPGVTNWYRNYGAGPTAQPQSPPSPYPLYPPREDEKAQPLP